MINSTLGKMLYENGLYNVVNDICHCNVIAAILFLLGTWIFFGMGESAFMVYAGIYLVIGIITMFVSALIGANNNFSFKITSSNAGEGTITIIPSNEDGNWYALLSAPAKYTNLFLNCGEFIAEISK